MDHLEFASVAKDILVGVLLVLSLALSGIGITAWYRLRVPRLLAVSIAFLLFTAKGLVLTGGMYVLGIVEVPREFAWTFDLMLLIDVLVLATLYLALFRKRR